MSGIQWDDNIFDTPAPASTNANTNATSISKPKGGIQCPNCGSHEIETHAASGASICTECAVIVEENAIVSSVDFAEGAGGAASMVGQFVAHNRTKAYGSSGYGMNDSRENTLAKGRRRIQDVASRLRLNSHFVDSAHRLYTIAVEKNFVQGRRQTHVTAACLYISCRQEKSSHMLIDFSDALGVNVYKLGTCFLKFRRLLGLELPIIDPALYVYRFAAHLDLSDNANKVAMTALRIVGRMKRDWIVAGRRPAGVCAAALLIASRAHGFDRGREDVSRVLRVCGMTVGKRLKEFGQTPSSRLTLEQFENHEIEQEMDPPIFTTNRREEARARAINNNDAALLMSGKLDDPMLEDKNRAQWRSIKKPALAEKEALQDQMYDDIGDAMEEDLELKKADGKQLLLKDKAAVDERETSDDDDDGDDDDNDDENKNDDVDEKDANDEAASKRPSSAKRAASIKKKGKNVAGKRKKASGDTKTKKNEVKSDHEEEFKSDEDEDENSNDGDDDENYVHKDTEEDKEDLIDVNSERQLQRCNTRKRKSYGVKTRDLVTKKGTDDNDSDVSQDMVLPAKYPKRNGKKLVLPTHATEEELQSSTQPTTDTIRLDDWKSDMPTDAVQDIDDLFRDEDEVKEREAVFNTLNVEYIAKMKLQKNEERKRNAFEKEMEGELDGDEDIHEASRKRYTEKAAKRKYNRRSTGDEDNDLSTEDALYAAVASRKTSRKINYDAMSAIFDSEGTFDTDLLEDANTNAMSSNPFDDSVFDVL